LAKLKKATKLVTKLKRNKILNEAFRRTNRVVARPSRNGSGRLREILMMRAIKAKPV
jgi:hypothetical protein